MKKILFLLFACISFLAYGQEAAKTVVTVIKAGRMVDVVNGRVESNQIIVVEGDKIKAVGAEGSIPVPAGASKLDLSNATILPGLIDSHTHIMGQIENYADDLFRKSSIDIAVVSHIYAKRTLDAGFTTVRSLGASELIDVAMKKAINAGKFPGPRLFVSGVVLSATGGHGDISGVSPYIEFQGFSGVVDGVDEIRKKVRWDVKYGADLIKFTATAGVLSEEESVGAPQFSMEEMKAIVEESHRWGKTVAAHAHGTEGIKMAVEAGATSIEHGSMIDEEGIQLMIQKGTYLVPTVYVGDAVEKFGKEWGLPDQLIEKARAINKTRKENLRKAVQAHVKIAYGTDAGVFPHGQNAADFVPLVELGMTPMQAIQSATKVASELLAHSNQFGSIQAGKYADLIAVIGDPIANIKLLEKVPFVMKGGVVYKNEMSTSSKP